MKEQIKKLGLILTAITIIIGMGFYCFNDADAYVKVNGYFRKDGTYVRPHVRSNPNGLKYDNYGYKPGQGLYNESYGKRDSYWDTPTWITDPNYYEGESLYESGSVGSYNPNIKSFTNNKWCPSPMTGAQKCYLWENNPTKHHIPPVFSRRIYKTINSSTVWELSHWSSFGWGTRKPFHDVEAFIKKGYRWSDIKLINQRELEKYKWTSRLDMYNWYNF